MLNKLFALSMDDKFYQTFCFFYDTFFYIGLVICGYYTLTSVGRWFTKRLSYVMSLRHAIRRVQDIRKNLPLNKLSTLNIHVVTSLPLYETEYYEWFMQNIVHLKKLKLTFVMQGRVYEKSFKPNISKWYDDQIVTYDVITMRYHMYYSSDQYEEPDAVVIYDNVEEMLTREEDLVHSEISYRNMTASKKTVLVLMDTTQCLLQQGINAVNSARPIDQLGKIPVLVSLFSKYYFTCLRRK